MQGTKPICARSLCEKQKKLLHFPPAFTIIVTQDIDARQKQNTKCSTKVRRNTICMNARPYLGYRQVRPRIMREGIE